MAILQSCCYWKTVRKGTFASAFYTLIYFGFSSLILLVYVNDEKEFLAGKRSQPAGESILERGDITTATVIFNILFLICSLLLVLSSLLVVIGLRSNKRELLLPWIVFMMCDVLIELAHLVYLSITQRVIFDPIVGFLFTMDFFIMCLNFYCLLCVISQYQEYRAGRAGAAGEQMTTSVLLRVPRGETVVNSTCLRTYADEKSVVEPFVKSAQQSSVSAINAEIIQQQKYASRRDMRDDKMQMFNALHKQSTQDRLKIPIIALDTNSCE